MTLSSTDTIENRREKINLLFSFLPFTDSISFPFYLTVDSKNVEGDWAEWSVYSHFDKAMDFTETHFGNEVIKNLCSEVNIF